MDYDRQLLLRNREEKREETEKKKKKVDGRGLYPFRHSFSQTQSTQIDMHSPSTHPYWMAGFSSLSLSVHEHVQPFGSRKEGFTNAKIGRESHPALSIIACRPVLSANAYRVNISGAMLFCSPLFLSPYQSTNYYYMYALRDSNVRLPSYPSSYWQ